VDLIKSSLVQRKKVETNDGSKKTATMEKHSLVDQKNNSFSMTKARKTSKPTFKFSRKALPIIAICACAVRFDSVFQHLLLINQVLKHIEKQN